MWTDMCRSNLLLYTNPLWHTWQLCGLIHLWESYLVPSEMTRLCEWFFLQKVHMCSFAPVCDWIWRWSPIANPRNFWHKLHWNGVLLLRLFKWILNWSPRANIFSHRRHLNGFLPLCVNWCDSRLPRWPNVV